jgi:hypothetical protein
MSREFAAQVSRMLDSLGVANHLLPVSCESGEGLDDLYALVQATVGGAEEGTPEYDTFLGPEADDIELN